MSSTHRAPSSPTTATATTTRPSASGDSGHSSGSALRHRPNRSFDSLLSASPPPTESRLRPTHHDSGHEFGYGAFPDPSPLSPRAIHAAAKAVAADAADDSRQPLLAEEAREMDELHDSATGDDGSGMRTVERSGFAAERRGQAGSLSGYGHEYGSGEVHAETGSDEEGESGKRGLDDIFANRYVALCAAFSALGGLLFGYDQGVVSVILVMPQFLDRFPSVADSAPGSGFAKGLLTAMIELGALVGALNQGWVADKISRKYSIVVAVGFFAAGSALQTAAGTYADLTIARAVGGVGIGMLSMVAPLYISEISPPQIRGTLLVLEEFSIVVGIVLAFWLTYATRYIVGEWAWRLPFLLQLVPGLVLGGGILFLPFSPRWLVAQGRDKEALTALAKLRQRACDDKRVRQEWLEIRAEVAFHKEVAEDRHPDLQGGSRSSRMKLELASWLDCFKRGCWRRTHVGMGLMFFQQFVGINALIYYSPTLFQTMGLSPDMQLIMSGVLNMVQLVGVASSIWTMDRLGRRPLLLAGSVCMSASHMVIAALVGKFSSDWPAHRTEGWISVAFLLFYMLSFGASWGPVPWAMPSEIFPSSLRGKGVALSTASNWLNNFIIGLITPPLVQNTGSGAYIFFAVFCLLSWAWVYVWVPETNGQTLEQMDALFQDGGEGGQQEEEARRIAIQRQLESRAENAAADAAE